MWSCEFTLLTHSKCPRAARMHSEATGHTVLSQVRQEMQQTEVSHPEPPQPHLDKGGMS